MTLPPWPAADRWVPALRHPPPPISSRRSRRSGDREQRRGDQTLRRASGMPRDASPPGTHRRLSLRGWLVRHQPPVGRSRVRDLYRTLIEPAVRPATSVTHVVFAGLDGYRSIVLIEDALADDVLVADRLDGRPFDSDHGASVRLVSPSQYGFMSTKHLCRIELHGAEPTETYRPAPLIQMGLQLVKPHRRATVWQEERHRYFRPVRPAPLPAPHRPNRTFVCTGQPRGSHPAGSAVTRSVVPGAGALVSMANGRLRRRQRRRHHLDEGDVGAVGIS